MLEGGETLAPVVGVGDGGGGEHLVGGAGDAAEGEVDAVERGAGHEAEDCHIALGVSVHRWAKGVGFGVQRYEFRGNGAKKS